MKRIYLLIFLMFGAVVGAQNGTLAGKVLDADFNDVLSFANVVVKGTNYGSSTDFDGKYSIQLPAGTYTVIFSFVGYETKEITYVVVTAGEVTNLGVSLKGSTSLNEVVVTVTKRKNSEAAVLEVQKNATVVQDGISSEAIKKQGASSVASAVKSVPGVSVQDGKYVYVRGLGDRYTKTLLNGMEVPGLDPDKNTLQLDVFPTNALENLQVVKSATAFFSSDFTGGIINIVTKDIPDSKEMSVSAGVSFNPDMHFNENFLTYEGGGTDYLGFDDGTRDSPVAIGQNIPLVQTNPNEVVAITRSFNPTMAVMREQNGMNTSFGFGYGNKFKFDSGNSLGLTASLSYKNSTSYYEDYIDGQIFRKDTNPDQYEVNVDRTQSGDLGTNTVLVNGLLGLTFKTDRSKYRFNAMHIQNGDQRAAFINQQNRDDSVNEIDKDILIYTQRSLSNIFLGGTHTNESGSWKVDWKVAPSLSRVDDKDFRVTPFRVDGPTPTIEPSEAGDPTRLFRELDEINIPVRLDFVKKHKLLGDDAKFTFGAGYTYKNRTFEVDQYSFILQNMPSDTFNGDANQILAPDNIYDVNTQSGVVVRSDFNISNNFDSEISIASAYISDEFKLSERLKTIVGLRFEKFDLWYTGQNQAGEVFNREQFINNADLFPSVNVIYDLNEDADFKLRSSFARTTARPTFKEASIAEIFDPVPNFFFIGNKDIRATYINNFDVRLEKYTEGTDYFAVSGFYKTFKDPIELSFIASADGQFTPLNLGDGNVLGAEIEVRKTLDFTGLRHFNFQSNISFINSSQKYSADEKRIRENTARTGQDVGDSRPLQGQSPYLINSGITYDNKGWKLGAFYNVQGRTLEIVGSADIPDVYTMPFHSLNFTLNKTWGEKVKSSISFKVDNILGDERESEYDVFNGTNQTFFFQAPNRTFSLGYGVKF